MTFWTRAQGLGCWRQHGAALCTSGNRVCAWHVQRPGAECFLLDRLLRGLFFAGLTDVLIAVLTIFSIRHGNASCRFDIVSLRRDLYKSDELQRDGCSPPMSSLLLMDLVSAGEMFLGNSDLWVNSKWRCTGADPTPTWATGSRAYRRVCAIPAYGFWVGRSRISLTNDCGAWVTSMATACATSSGCSILDLSLPAWGLNSVSTEPGHTTDTRIL